MEKFTQAPVGLDIDQTVSSNSQAIANLNNKYFALDSATGLPNNTNFNSLITAGCWRILSYSSASTMTNIPKASAGTLYIKNSMLETGSDYIEQMYWTHQNEIFLRHTTDKGSTWSSWQELAKKSDFTTITDKQIIRTSGTSYFTERSGFISRKIGNTIGCLGYFNVTTQIPESTTFANLQQGSAGIFGSVGLVNIDDKKVYVASVDGGNLQTRTVVPVGYYYIIGTLFGLI